jgi:CBS domain-containing protein
MTEQTDDRVRVLAEELAPEDADRAVMICPVCGYSNLQGDDQCANCGADLRTSDIPVATSPFERLLVDVSLGSLPTRKPFTVRDDMPVAAVLDEMRTKATADVLVLHGDRLVGIFTERDALMKLAGTASASGVDLASTPISAVMTHDPVVLRATDSVAVAVQKMAVGGFRHIPLVDHGRPIGVVSATDVFRHILRIVE